MLLRALGTAPALFLAALLLLTPAHALAKDADASAALGGASAQERIAKAAELEKTDIDALVDAFDALGGRKVKRGDDVGPDLEFLAEYVVTQKSRALRTMAIDAGARLDDEAFAARLRALADGEDRLRSALAAEALGMVGGEDDVPRLLELAKSSSISIAVRACRAIARIGDKKDAEAVMEIALDHEDPEVGDHAAWAAQDLLKTQKAMLSKMKRLMGRDPPPERALRFASLEAMLADYLKPFDWKPSLEPARELIQEAPETITIEARNPDHAKKVEETLAWLKENLPGQHLVVRAAVASIQVPMSPPDGHLDTETHVVGIPLSYTAQTAEQLSYHIVRAATVIWEKRVGHPFTGHRGWENAVFDTFDVCEVAGLYNAGKGGINRDQFLEEILSKRPWGGN